MDGYNLEKNIMNTININSKQLLKLHESIFRETYQDGPYAYAFELGFGGFCGGEDHIEVRPWSILIVDRGLSSGSGYHDGTTRFCVHTSEREGEAPLQKFRNI